MRALARIAPLQVFLPRAIHHLLLLGVPSMLHARRMLPPGHAAGTGSAAGEGHSGLGGSVGLLSNIVRNAGPSGLLISKPPKITHDFYSHPYETTRH
jgi:hypothetical protein